MGDKTPLLADEKLLSSLPEHHGRGQLFEPVTKTERRAWILYDWANSPFWQTVVGVFLPVYVTEIVKADNPGDDFVSVLGFRVLITSYFPLLSSISVFIQVLAFLTCSSLADFGSFRRKGLFFSIALGATLQTLWFFIGPSHWEIGSIVFIVTNVVFGVSVVFYNGFLPLLTAAAPAVLEAKAAGAPLAQQHQLEHDEANSISSHGMAFGYLGSVVNLGVMLLILEVWLHEDWLLAARVGLGVTGLWWLGFGLLSAYGLKERAGPALPPNANYLTHGWISAYHTLRRIRRLPQMFRFLLSYFIYSDAVSTITYSSAIYAKDEIGLPTSVILGSVLLFLVTAIVGNYMYLGMISIGWVTSQQVLVINLVSMMFLPVYAFFALGPGTYTGYFAMLVVYGINVGSLQAFSRTLFSKLIPPGHESEMFGFFEISDKGTGWLGPLMVTIIASATGEFRMAFWGLFVFLLIGTPLAWSVDMELGAEQARAYPRNDGITDDQLDADGAIVHDVADAVFADPEMRSLGRSLRVPNLNARQLVQQSKWVETKLGVKMRRGDGKFLSVLSSQKRWAKRHGPQLHYTYNLPGGKARGLVFWIHGLGDHASRYEDAFDEIVKHGYAVYAHDAFAHGFSEGQPRANIRVDDLIADQLAFVDLILEQRKAKGSSGDVPIFLVGVHLGGLVAMFTAARRPEFFRGVIVTSTAVAPPPTWTRARQRANALASVVTPQLVTDPLKPEMLTRDKKAQDAWRLDPLIFHQGVRAVVQRDILQHFLELEEIQYQMTYPLLAIHGTDDTYASPAAMEAWVKKWPHDDAVFLPLDDMLHDLWGASDRVDVLNRIVQWMNKRYNVPRE